MTMRSIMLPEEWITLPENHVSSMRAKTVKTGMNSWVFPVPYIPSAPIIDPRAR